MSDSKRYVVPVGAGLLVSMALASPSGGSGHHVLGNLSFPLRDSQGTAVLEGATFIILRIEGVDAPVREFRWELGGSR